MAIPRAANEERVTALELFFDLVFVFAITQVTALMAEDPTWGGVGRGLLVLAALWFAWASYAWLTNTLNPEEGSVRLAMFAIMAALLVCSLSVPGTFEADGDVFGIAYLVVRTMHIALYAISARSDPTLGVVVRNLALSAIPTAVLICVAGFTDGAIQYVLWVVAIAIDMTGPFLRGVDGWRLHPGHFAERHGLFMIIALGESIVALGVGAGGQEVSAEIVAAAVLGVAIAAALWWAYFDVVALVAERRLKARQGADRARNARDSYTFLHLPMVAGVILFALGVKKVLLHVDEPLKIVPAVALAGGVSLYLLAHIAFRWRNVGSFNRQRFVTAVVLALLIPVIHEVDGLLALVIVAGTCCGLIAYEAIRFREARHRIRHAEAVHA